MEPERPDRDPAAPDRKLPPKPLGRPSDVDPYSPAAGTPASSETTPGSSRPTTGSSTSGSSSYGSPAPFDSSASRTAPPDRPKRSGPGGILALVLVVLMAVFGYLYYGGNHTSTGGNTPAASSQTDMLAAETQSPEYQKHKNRKPGSAAQFSRADLDAKATDAAIQAARAGQAIPGLNQASPELTKAVGENRVKFYSVRAYDTCAEDGDWVTLSTESGARIGSFMLTKAGTTITIPVIDGVMPNLTLTGDKDGVGGITAGLVTSLGTWYSGILQPGETEPVPLVMR